MSTIEELLSTTPSKELCDKILNMETHKVIEELMQSKDKYGTTQKVLESLLEGKSQEFKESNATKIQELLLRLLEDSKNRKDILNEIIKTIDNELSLAIEGFIACKRVILETEIKLISQSESTNNEIFFAMKQFFEAHVQQFETNIKEFRNLRDMVNSQLNIMSMLNHNI